VSAQPTNAPDPSVLATIALVRQAIDELGTKPDDGSLWKAKLALLDALQHLVRARRGDG
jgi:hypothetical protein